MNFSIEERELTIESILQDSWSLFKGNFYLLILPIFLFFLLDFGTLFLNENKIFLSGFLTVPFALLSYAFIALYLNYFTSIILKNEAVSFNLLIKKSIDKWPSAIWVGILSLFVLMFFFVLLIIPGIVCLVYLYFVSSVVALREAKGLLALDYSYKLVNGRWFKVARFVFFFTFIGFVPLILFHFIYLYVPKNIWLEVIELLLSSILGVLLSIAATILFLHLDAVPIKAEAD